jgi:DUF438 domain-containing protein
MNIQAEKIELVKMLLDTENPEIIESIKNIFKKENSSDFWNELSLAEQNEIKQGIEELDNGKRVSYESVLKKIS